MNGTLEMIGLTEFSDEKMQEIKDVIKKLEEFKPQFRLQFRKKVVKPLLTGFDESLFSIESIESDIKNQLAEGFLEVLNYNPSYINPINSRKFLLETIIRPLGSGFFEITLQEFEILLKDQRNIEKKPRQKLIYWVGYDKNQHHYYLSRSEDPFKQQYQPLSSLLERDEVNLLIETFNEYIDVLFKRKNLIGELDTFLFSGEELYLLYYRSKKVFEVVEMYLDLMVQTSSYDFLELETLQRYVSFIKKEIVSKLGDFVEMYDIKEFKDKEKFIEVLKNLSFKEFSDEKKIIEDIKKGIRLIKELADTGVFIHYKEGYNCRTLLEWYNYHQPAELRFETTEYMDVEYEYVLKGRAFGEKDYETKSFSFRNAKKRMTIEELRKKIRYNY